MSTTSISERVAAGVEWLDENVPGWLERIDLKVLMLSSCERCVMGQIYGDYELSPVDRDDEMAVNLGFLATSEYLDTGATAEEEEAEYAALTAEWVRVIQERRQSAGEAS